MARPKPPDKTMGYDLLLAEPYLDDIGLGVAAIHNVDHLNLFSIAEWREIDIRCECKIGAYFEKKEKKRRELGK